MVDYKEFSRQIKDKYPEYKDVDDLKLANAMIEKYPEYKEQVTFKSEPTRPRSKGLFEPMTNEDVKDYYKNELAKRKEWEQDHPFISSLQKDFQPGYRAQQIDMEERAKYGLKVPFGEGLKNDLKRFGQNLVPAANITAAIGTGGMTAGAKSLLPLVGRGAAQGAIQGGVLGASHELGDNGLSLNVIPETLKGTAAGGAIGGGLPLIGYPISKAANWLLPRMGASLGGVTTDTVEQAIKPNSRALDLNADQAKALLLDTTSNIRNGYNNLVSKAGENVQNAVNKLRNNKYRVDTTDLLDDINSTFNQYQGESINPARNMTGRLEENLEDLIVQGSKETPIAGGASDIIEQTVSPIDLEKAKQQIGSMINWQDETARNFKNPILEQIYGKFNNRLSDLSPELSQANEAFANLRGFKNNEGLRSVLRAGDSIDSASQTLKNYKSTVTKGNTGRNIQDLENTLVANGEKPFLNTVDDINAAMDLENSLKTGRNFLGVTDLAKQVLLRPTLKAARWYNSSKLPRTFYNAKNAIKKVAIPFMYNSPRLFSGIEYEDEY